MEKARGNQADEKTSGEGNNCQECMRQLYCCKNKICFHFLLI